MDRVQQITGFRHPPSPFPVPRGSAEGEWGSPSHSCGFAPRPEGFNFSFPLAHQCAPVHVVRRPVNTLDVLVLICCLLICWTTNTATLTATLAESWLCNEWSHWTAQQAPVCWPSLVSAELAVKWLGLSHMLPISWHETGNETLWAPNFIIAILCAN